MWPGAVRQLPADEILYFARIMGIEAEARQAMEGMKPEDEFFRES